MRFLWKRAFQQDPSRGWANTGATDCKQAEGPALGPRLSPGLRQPPRVSPALLTLAWHTESFHVL